MADLSEFSEAFADGTTITAVLNGDTNVASETASDIATHTADLDSIVIPSDATYTLANSAFDLINAKLNGTGSVDVVEVSGAMPADLQLNQELTYNFDINGTYTVGQDGDSNNLRISGVGEDDTVNLDNNDKLVLNADAAEDFAQAIKVLETTDTL